MRRALAILATLMLLSLPLSSAAGNPGEDRLPDTETTPFSSVSATSPSVDGKLWELSFSLDQGYVDNNTTVKVISQICTNDGVCDPPVPQTLKNDGEVYSTSLTPPEDHTYVNFQITLIDENGTEVNYPPANWYTTWSTCYYDDGEWGGEDSSEEGCKDGLPKWAIIAGVSGVAVIALVYSRRN